MFKRYGLPGFLFSLFMLTSVEAAPFSLERVKKILAPYGAQVGFSLRDAHGKEIFEIHGKNSYAPASVAKMVSSACSLRTLTPQFQFETVFGYTGTLKAGVLSGDLVIQGSGDPSFVIEDLKEVLEKLQVAFGIQEVKGHLVFDASYLGTSHLEISEGFQGDSGRSFTADLTAIPFNFNSFSIWVVPNKPEARVQILPKDVLKLKIVNQIKVTTSGATEVSADYQATENKVIVSGRISENAEPKAFYRSVPDGYAALAQVLVRSLGELGVKWAVPKWKIETKPVAMQRLYVHRSKAVSRQLLDINKLSTNFGSELVSLAAGVKEKGRPASFEKAKSVLESCLKSYDILPTQIYLENASGLSRKSTMQPSGLTLFLSRLQSEDYWPEYLSTLSTLGRDGTYAKRLLNFAGQARLKSGSLQGVTTLAGFLYPRGSDPLTFALLFNCPSCDRGKVLAIEDEVLKAILE